MNVLINASNLKVGGGIQVCDSVCRELYKYTSKHHFTVVLPSALEECAKAIEMLPCIYVVRYSRPLGFIQILTGRNAFLDGLVEQHEIEMVFTLFGPSVWIPKCRHLCGFALSHLVLSDSPFFKSVSWKDNLKLRLRLSFIKRNFRMSANAYYTENPFISMKLKELFPKKKVYTVTNNYNQVFDYPEMWNCSVQLPYFDGFTLLTVCANYPHKNLPIIVPCIHILRSKYPDLKFRFILTIREEEYIPLSEEEREHVLFLGAVRINQCPGLYQQVDAMFLPSLLECFSASYAEAMRMRKAIITTDLGFAHSLCGDAAEYYEATSASALADSIYKVATDRLYYDHLLSLGDQQLKEFDTYEERARKLIEIMESYEK